MTEYEFGDFHRDHDIHPDGDRFAMIRTDFGEDAEIVLVLNWFEELRERLGQ